MVAEISCVSEIWLLYSALPVLYFCKLQNLFLKKGSSMCPTKKKILVRKLNRYSLFEFQLWLNYEDVNGRITVKYLLIVLITGYSLDRLNNIMFTQVC